MIMTLEQAISIASLAHEGQLDKGGEPYILHPLRVMMKLKDTKQRIVAVLHDVIEDTHWTYVDLKVEGLDLELVSMVLILTRNKNESYDEYINRISKDSFAIKIKLADLEDNMDMSRINNPTGKDYDRVVKYGKAREKLMNALVNMQ
jgi:(p)ppGpp synthase/HD superfamily hydrolase